ncbi:MAG: transposase [Clostridia bacterium]|nr:transposase [Clostridia bacterium]
MPRKARIKNLTNFSHIIVQGIERTYIFQEEYFKKLYLTLIQKNLEDTNIEILAYCVMDNHVHILLYQKNSNELTNFMLKVNTSFAIKYNKIKNRIGYVFRDRYYLQPITSERQLYNCLVYIHRNPIAANLSDNYDKYPFSSYKEFYNNEVLITDNGKKLIFGSSKNYFKTFEKIHKDRIINDIRDVQEYKEADIVIKDFINHYKKNIIEIKNDKVLFQKLLLKLKLESKLSLRKMENIFSIGKDTLNKIMKN